MLLKNKNSKYIFINKSNNFGFTIVELLVVIVVIGILAAITIVSYTGISGRAKVAAIQSDLSNASKQIKLFQVTEADGSYPTANNCPTPGTNEICLKSSNNNTYTYASNNMVNPKVFALNATNGTMAYSVTNNSSPATGAVSLLAITDPANWLAIGGQTWAKANLNVGTMVTGTTTQTNNSILEKYCYSDLESNCTTYGGLYSWDEAMQYVATPTPPVVAQGLCPADSHVPSDNDWKILEMQLGMTQVQADATGERGTNQGAQLKTSGTSGLKLPTAGYRFPTASFSGLPERAYLWSSSEYGDGNVWFRDLWLTPYIDRSRAGKAFGMSVRCVGN